MDLGTAQKYNFTVGEHVRILLLGPTRTFTITGLTRFGTANNLAGATLAAFDIPTAQALLGHVGQFDNINVVTSPGSEQGSRPAGHRTCAPHGVEVVTGQTVINEQTSAVSQALGIFSTFLLVFGFIALFVGAFTILNTFSIIVGQRTRELALLRIVGASRRQVFRSVLGEAAVVGLVSSLIGLGLGVLAAVGLEKLLAGFGVTLPTGSIVFADAHRDRRPPRGRGRDLVAAIGPARRAVRIAPVAAVSDHLTEDEMPMRRRFIRGGVITLIGVRPARRGTDAAGHPAGGLGRGPHLRRRGHAGAGPGASRGERHRASAGPAPRHVRPPGPGEFDAQPAANRPDVLGPDGGARTGVGHRRASARRCRGRPRPASTTQSAPI